MDKLLNKLKVIKKSFERKMIYRFRYFSFFSKAKLFIDINLNGKFYSNQSIFDKFSKIILCTTIFIPIIKKLRRYTGFAISYVRCLNICPSKILSRFLCSSLGLSFCQSVCLTHLREQPRSQRNNFF